MYQNNYSSLEYLPKLKYFCCHKNCPDQPLIIEMCCCASGRVKGKVVHCHSHSKSEPYTQQSEVTGQERFWLWYHLLS